MTNMITLPHPRSYWAVPGRLLAGCYPGDKTASVAEMKLHGLIRCGVSHVVNLMEPDERDHQGKMFEPYHASLHELAKAIGRKVECHPHPIRDLSVPSVATMRVVLDSIDTVLGDGGIVYVHCWGGRGRTGTVIGCHLARHGLAAEGNALDALALLTADQHASFRRVPDTEEQRAFVQAWRCGQ